MSNFVNPTVKTCMQCKDVFASSVYGFVINTKDKHFGRTINHNSAMELFSRMRRRLYRPKCLSFVFMTKPCTLWSKYIFTFHTSLDRWADTVVHLLLIKSSMSILLKNLYLCCWGRSAGSSCRRRPNRGPSRGSSSPLVCSWSRPCWRSEACSGCCQTWPWKWTNLSLM